MSDRLLLALSAGCFGACWGIVVWTIGNLLGIWPEPLWTP